MAGLERQVATMSKISRKSSGRRREDKSLIEVRRGIVGALLIAFGLGAGWAGYEIGLRDQVTPGDRFLGSLQCLFDAERRRLDKERTATGEHLDALALKLGQMQAELLRLNALGERLVAMGELDKAEFDFSAPPAVGGAESTDALSNSLPEMVADLDRLAQALEDRELKLGLLEELLLQREVREDTRPAGRPVSAGWISSTYGWRRDPFSGKKAMHRGLDFAGKPGSDIIAVADGVVSYAGPRAGFGKTVEIRHGNGFVTRYAHNSALLVELGDLVRQGQVIAAMGRSGRATGTHLHFEVIRKGKTLNPIKFVKAPRKEPSSGG
jgi:murein DD-endopeptidase MepM/ murein hydrolase activator NlpD